MIDDIIAEGDKIAVRLTSSASQKEDYAGIPATSKKVAISAIHMMVITNGKINRFWALEDTLGFMNQLGMELKPKEVKK
jgi:predicted ester cyclase